MKLNSQALHKKHVEERSKPPKSRKRAVFYGFSLTIFLLIVCALIYITIKQQIIEKLYNQERMRFKIIQSNIDTKMAHISSEISMIVENSLIPVAYKNDLFARMHLTSDLKQIIESDTAYLQLRLYDSSGSEIIRINKTGFRTSEATQNHQLKNNKSHYYFNKAENLPKNSIYISPFDLNVKNGEIETPNLPVIRFCAPIFNNQNKHTGVIGINYSATALFQHLTYTQSNVELPIELLNNSGYYLFSPDTNKLWGFILPEREQQRYDLKNSELWSTITTQKEGAIQNDNNHLLFSTLEIRIPPPLKSNKHQSLYMVCTIPKEVITNITAQLTQGLCIGFFLLGPLLFYLGWRMGNYQVHQRWLFSLLEQEATHDPLTGLYNRKALYDILNKTMYHSIRRDSPLSVCFLDLNDLKAINDEYGHEMGDTMLKHCTNAILSNIRMSDSASRIGGDEFVIIFPDCNAASAEVILNRISLSYSATAIEASGHLRYISYGCTEMLKDDQQPESIIDRADNRMYEHKKKNKSEF
jgi:diguanylate cyclase (GGDEF)-like protein